MKVKKPFSFSSLLLKGLLIFIAFLVFLHLVLNTTPVQNFIKNKLNTLLSIDLDWDHLTFNGATGHLSARLLHLQVPKNNLSVDLKQVTLAINPLSLVFGKIHLLTLNADDLFIALGSQEEQSDPSKKPLDPEKVFSILSVDRAQISHIHFEKTGGTTLDVAQVQIGSPFSFKTFSRQLTLTLNDLKFISPKLDTFVDSVSAKGTMGFAKSPFSKNSFPEWDGLLTIKNVLLGFNHTVSTWNTDPYYDPVLEAPLQKAYNGQIPQNRVFMQIENLPLPLTLNHQKITIDPTTLKIFGGELEVESKWDLRKSTISTHLKTDNPLKMALLPLGKLKLRRTFKDIHLDLNLDGSLDSTTKNLEAKGKLTAQLNGNPFNPEIDQINLDLPYTIHDGTITTKPFTLKLGVGILEGDGLVSFKEKRFDTHLHGTNLDAITVIHFFSTLDIGGLANVDGTIGGPFENPAFHLNLFSNEASFEGLTVGQFTGQLDIKDRNMTLNGNTLLGKEGEGEINLHLLEVFTAADQRLDLKTSLTKAPLNLLFKSNVINGIGNLNFSMTKYRDDYRGTGEGNIEHFSWYKLNIPTITAQVSLIKRDLQILNQHFVLEDNSPTIAIDKPLLFHFIDGGFKFDGPLLPNITIRGEKNPSDPRKIQIHLTANQAQVDFLKVFSTLPLSHINTTGQFDIQYFSGKPEATDVVSNLNEVIATGENRHLHLSKPTTIHYNSGNFNFNNTSLTLNESTITLNGLLSTLGNSHFNLLGDLDLSQIGGFFDWLIEGEGIVPINLLLTGPFDTLKATGSVILNKTTLLVRQAQGELTNMTGQINFLSGRMQTDHLTLRYNESPMSLNGWVDWRAPIVTAADLAIEGEDISINEPNTWQTTNDLSLKLTGSNGHLMLSGFLQLVDGLYYKDYSLTQFILKPVNNTLPGDGNLSAFPDLSFDLRVRSSGDFIIRNNLADLSLQGDIAIKGKYGAPELNGTINVQDGNIHAFGIDFEEPTGFISFLPTNKDTPYLELNANRTISDYEVTVKIAGFTDNLRLTLESTPSLNQNDIFSLIAYGQTSDQLTTNRQNLFSTTAVASQVVGALQRPLTKATKLDIVKLESDPQSNPNAISRFSIGKKLTDRLSVAFTTDLTVDQAQKGFEMEYQLLDNLLLKGIKDTGARYRFDLTLRFEMY